LSDGERKRGMGEVEGEGEVYGGSAAAVEDADTGGSRPTPATPKRGFSGVFPEPKQGGSDFWVRSFSDFNFGLMGTKFFGRKSLRKTYWYGKIIWVLEGFRVKKFNGVGLVDIIKFSDFDFSLDGFGFRWRNRVGL
jgi:hypothetical protein